MFYTGNTVFRISFILLHDDYNMYKASYTENSVNILEPFGGIRILCFISKLYKIHGGNNITVALTYIDKTISNLNNNMSVSIMNITLIVCKSRAFFKSKIIWYQLFII